ncbi:MAG: alpha/beta hydrolase [Pseudomonadota bacterium]
MPILRLNAVDDRPVPPGGEAFGPALRCALSASDPDIPALVMIHGYKYTPFDPARCPHGSIFAANGVGKPRRCASWPRAMGFTPERTGNGLCIAFGWDAAGTIWQAARSAESASRALSHLVSHLAAYRGRPVHVLAHSLGARVALGGLKGADGGAVGRMVLLHGAELRSRALNALDHRAGTTTEIVNVTTRENDLFDMLFRASVAPHRPLDPALSAGLGTRRTNWLDMRIDDPATRAALKDFGFDIPAPVGRVCHWSAYMRAGMFDLHRALLCAREPLPLAMLARVLPDGARRGLLERTFAREAAICLPRGAQASS